MNDLSSVDPMLALAELMLNADELRARTDDAALQSARREQQQALREEVDALHEAAHDVRFGAFIEGAATAVGGTVGGIAHGDTPLGQQPTGWRAALLESGHALIGMAGPAGRELGQAPSMDEQAKAKQAEQEGADAGTRAEQSNRHYDRVRDDQDRMLATLADVLQSESQGNLAIIANV
jgi:hypothetical protein